MFDTLVLQQPNKLVKCQIGDFPSPEAFHSCQVQRFKSKSIKASTKVSGEFPMPIQALPTDLTIQPCDFPNSTPPIIRTFDFPRQALVEVPELFQGLFQELRRLYLLTCVERQKSVLHTEVCSYALSCSGQWVGRSIVSDDVKPIFTNSIAKDLDIPDISIPFAMLMKRKPDTPELKGLRGFIPFFDRKLDTPRLKFVAGLELPRSHLMLCFELRKTDTSPSLSLLNPVKVSLVGKMETDNHRVKRVTRYPRPMFLSALEEFGKMRLQTIPACVFAIATVVSLFQTQEVVMNIAKVVKHIAQAFVLRGVAYLMFVGSQGIITSYKSLTPNEWVGRHVTLRLRSLCLPTGM